MWLHFYNSRFSIDEKSQREKQQHGIEIAGSAQTLFSARHSAYNNHQAATSEGMITCCGTEHLAEIAPAGRSRCAPL
jgi:hypothetical protein